MSHFHPSFSFFHSALTWWMLVIFYLYMNTGYSIVKVGEGVALNLLGKELVLKIQVAKFLSIINRKL